LKQVRVILSPEAEEVFKYLNKEAAESSDAGKRTAEARIFDAFNKKVEIKKIHWPSPDFSPGFVWIFRMLKNASFPDFSQGFSR